ncbi:MAG TPA: hypothetical protein PK077_07690, partial [Akkermansia muciniphila]|nr:hypothetical protein [Akkermansia muciniphila]
IKKSLFLAMRRRRQGGMGFRCCGVSSEQLNQKGPEKPQPGTVARPFGPVNSAHKQERGKIGQ